METSVALSRGRGAERAPGSSLGLLLSHSEDPSDLVVLPLWVNQRLSWGTKRRLVGEKNK